MSVSVCLKQNRKGGYIEVGDLVTVAAMMGFISGLGNYGGRAIWHIVGLSTYYEHCDRKWIRKYNKNFCFV